MLLAVLADRRRQRGCVRSSPRQEALPEASSSPALDDWQASARAMLADALATLRTFEVFAAYRVSVTPSSELADAVYPGLGPAHGRGLGCGDAPQSRAARPRQSTLRGDHRGQRRSRAVAAPA